MKASVAHIRAKFAVTERRACRLLPVPASSYRYRPRQNDSSLRERLIALARKKPRFGYRRLHVLLGREGEQVNHKRVHRIYREAGLTLRHKKRKHCVRQSMPLGIYTAANQEWALDFLHDAVASGRSIRVLNVIDAYTRESLAMDPPSLLLICSSSSMSNWRSDSLSFVTLTSTCVDDVGQLERTLGLEVLKVSHASPCFRMASGWP